MKPLPSATQSPPPPVPKPRLRNSVEGSKPKTSSNLADVSTTLPVGDIILTSSSGYENIPKPKSVPNYEDIEQQPPPIPKPRAKNSLDDNMSLLATSSVHQSHDNLSVSKTSSTKSGYENVPNAVLQPDYEDIDLEDNNQPHSYEAAFPGELQRTSSDRIIFLNEDYYSDPMSELRDNNQSYNDQMQPPFQPSTYEVPVNLISSPIPPQRSSSNVHSPILNDVPPVPPPRNRNNRPDSSIHRSLLDLGGGLLKFTLYNRPSFKCEILSFCKL